MIRFSILLLLFLLYSCRDKAPQLTWDTDKTVLILADLRLMDNQIKKHKFYQKDSVAQLFRNKLLKIHKISEDELVQNINFIQKNPSLSKSLEIKMENFLKDRRSVLDSLKKEALKETK